MKKNLLKKWLSLFLMIVVVASSIHLDAFADAVQESEELYLKSLKIAIADNASDAKKELEAEGYLFLDANLNKGTGEDGVYLGYTTTTNPEEAIYDMKLMNMNGGFTRSSMENALENHKSVFAEMADDLNMLIEEFLEAYDEGTVPAQNAYKALNFFSMVDKQGKAISEENGLGYHLINGNFTIESLTEMILFCDSFVVDSVIKILTMGIQTRNGNWLSKLSKLGPYDSEKDYGMDSDELKRRAEQLLPILKVYAQAYNAMEATGIVSGEFNEEGEIVNTEYTVDYTLEAEDSDVKNMDMDRYQSYKLAFDKLENYSYGSNTLKDFFCGLEDSSNTKQLYPLVSVLSDGEYSALSYGCVLEVMIGADVSEQDFAEYNTVYGMVTEEVQSVYLYGGVDEELLEDDTIVAFTEEANRHMASTGEMEFYEKESKAEDIWENGKNTAMLVAASGMLVSGLAKVGVSVGMFLTGVYSTTALAAAKTGFAGVILKACVFLGNPWAVPVVMAVALTVALVAYIISEVITWQEGTIDWDDNPIPEYIYDIKDVEIKQAAENSETVTDYIKTTSFTSYEVVRDIHGDPADLNAHSNDASQWVSLYVSYDILGDNSKPIKANDLKVQYGQGQTPEDYVPLCEFGEVIAKDLNSYDEENDVNGIYVFYKQDNEIAVDNGKTYYISNIYLQAGESSEHCIGLLENAGYTPINVNLSPEYKEAGFFEGDDIYTYLGYKTTTNKRLALRDIRISTETNASPYYLGDASYAEYGSSAGVTLYASKYESTGTPILAGSLLITESILDAPAGYEPVNLFSGGPAVSINSDNGFRAFMEKSYYLHFLPEVTFTEGEKYLDSIAFFQCDFGDLLRMSTDYKEEIASTLMNVYSIDCDSTELESEELASLYLLAAFGYDTAVHKWLSDCYVYNYTYNPYRAVYDIVGTQKTEMPDSLTWQSLYYAASPTISFDAYHPGEEWTDPNYYINNTKYYGYPDMTGKLYVTGNTKGNTYNETKGEMSKTQPIKYSEFICQRADVEETEVPSTELGFYPLTDIFASTTKEISIKNKNGDKSYKFYLANRDREELPYVSDIYITDWAQICQMYGGAEAGANIDIISDGMALSILASNGATKFCSDTVTVGGWQGADYRYNAGLEDINRYYFGYSKSSKGSEAYRDMFLYYNGLSAETPPDKLYRGSVKYDLVSKINYNFTSYADCIAPGVYLYATTDSDAGERIVDFTVSDYPFKAGYETVRTMNGRSLVGELVDELKKEKNANPLSVVDGMVDEWINFFSATMENDDTPHPVFYLHFKREGEAPKQQYISDIYIAKKDGSKELMLDDLFDQGAEGYVNKDLNASTIGDSIYLGYSYTTDADNAITSMKAYHSKSHGSTYTDSSGIKYYLAADIDLNDGAGGDYIYLYYTKEQFKDGGTPISKIESSGKVKNSSTDTETISTMTHINKGDASDLNDGCGFWSDYIYLLLTRPKDCPSTAEFVPDYGTNKTYTRKPVTGEEEGAYIGAVYVMDKNTLRQEKQDVETESTKWACSDISDEEVFARLKEMGATTIIETPICISSGSKWEGNKNKVFIGYSRTDTLRNAIKGLAIEVKLFSDKEPEESIAVDNKTHKLVAEGATKVEELPQAINLIGLENTQNSLMPKMYLYTTTSGTEPIREICIDKNPILNGWNTVRSQNGKETFVDLYNQTENAVENLEKGLLDKSSWDGTYMFVQDNMNNMFNHINSLTDPEDAYLEPFYIHYKTYEEESLEEVKPCIGEIYLAKGDSKHEALANLVAHNPDGYVNCDLNKDAGGDYVYMAYKRTESDSKTMKPITDLVISQGKDKEKTIRITDSSSNSIKYELTVDLDLNEDAGGKYLYLYSTTDTKAGGSIIDLRVSVDDIINKKTGCFKESTVRRVSDGKYTDEYIDLNKGAGGDYIYLVMKRVEHNPAEAVKENIVEATCSTDGSYNLVVYCGDCGEVLSSTAHDIPATGEHIDGDDEDHNCDVCNQADIEEHTPGEPVEEDRIEPTADADGSYKLVVYCTECGEKLSEETVVIPAAGEATTEEAAGEEASTEEEADSGLTGTMFGSGSVIALILLGVIGLGAALMIVFKKKKFENEA